MFTVRPIPLTLAALLLSSGCVYSPLNGGPTGGAPNVNRTISGYAPSASTVVEVFASPTGTGDWQLVGTTMSSGSPTRFYDGTELYSFSASLSIPAHRWSQASCAESQTYIRIRSSGIYLPTFDDESVSGVSASSCMTAQQTAGASFISAILACQSVDSPVLRIVGADNHAIAGHVGNLVIDDQADLATWGSLESLTGNLTIGGSWTLDVEMPLLTSVSGDVTATYPRQPNETYPAVRSLSLPALTTVGGDINLTSAHPGGGSQIISISWGMPALASVGGDVDIDIDTFNVNASGLGALTHIPGDLTVVTGSGDTSGMILSGLQSVAGNVELDLGHTLVSILGNLTSVGGNFVLSDGNPTPNVLDNLTTVGGDFTLGDIAVFGPPGTLFFPSLTTVSGRITLAGTWLDGLSIGALPLTASALTLDANAALTDLGPGDVRVDGPGSIEITANANLCSSVVTAFLAGQPSWTGSSVVAGNDDGC